jgi:hypothetical protein
LLAESPNDVQKLFDFGRAAVDDLAELHDSLAVENEHGPPVVSAVIAPNPVSLGHLALRVEIGQQGKIEATELLGKRLVRMYAVNTDAQDLGAELREARQVILQRAKLTSSSAGEVERVEGQNNDAALYVTQRQRALAEMGRQREVGRKIAYHQLLIGHGPLLMQHNAAG